ncbi:tyrosine-protein phosphatase [Urechidicola croceus]|uniref:protein-tyrosine-phosphatase n=1 Tax=Urechidicola croceus TaxID=1850246 RepID=A0A1D8P690_9FLAO|nr:CpsB/CapC family capsule biosynthesis tyrosine phosphatase [Urechidicola croceus]AOW20086.1 histidinol phosphatase [Urechidicola croceus]
MFFFKKKLTPINELFPNSFVDIHSHLLPGIDDGAKTLEDSIFLIKKMKSFGIKNIITTPHILGTFWPNTPEIINDKLALVKNELLNQHITDVNLSAAAEYMLDERFMKLLYEKKLLTIKDNYVLIELSYVNPPENIFDLIFEIQTNGYIPILAHPERYIFYHYNFKNYKKLKDLGCYFQLNLLSLTEYYGREVYSTAIQLLKNNLIDFAGTDTHNDIHLKKLKELGTAKNVKLLKPLLLKNNLFNNFN